MGGGLDWVAQAHDFATRYYFGSYIIYKENLSLYILMNIADFWAEPLRNLCSPRPLNQ